MKKEQKKGFERKRNKKGFYEKIRISWFKTSFSTTHIAKAYKTHHQIRGGLNE